MLWAVFLLRVQDNFLALRVHAPSNLGREPPSLRENAEGGFSNMTIETERFYRVSVKRSGPKSPLVTCANLVNNHKKHLTAALANKCFSNKYSVVMS